MLQAAKAAGQIGVGGAFNKVNVPDENIHKTTLSESGIASLSWQVLIYK
jgi:hypothetical protein